MKPSTQPANDSWHPLSDVDARRASDIADVCDRLWDRLNEGLARNFRPADHNPQEMEK
jgi:hypothetical protein